MSTRAPDEALDLLFRRARTFSTWLDRPVPDHLLREVYDLMKWGPTSMNGCPVRILFLRSKESKERLRPALSPGNVQKTMAAPVTAIIANDMKFYDKLPKLMPHNPNAGSLFENSPELAEVTARRNARPPQPVSPRLTRRLSELVNGWPKLSDLRPDNSNPSAQTVNGNSPYDEDWTIRSRRKPGHALSTPGNR